MDSFTIPSILITDDDRSFRDTVRQTLEPYGYRLSMAADGEEALRILQSDDVHLLLLDMHMPRLTGIQTVDYPPLCADIGRQVVDGRADFGIVIGGSGSGEQIASNKVRGVRAALCHCLFTTEIARAHNDANVLVMGAKVVTPDLAEDITATWLATSFKGGRHQRRVDQIAALERGEPLV